MLVEYHFKHRADFLSALNDDYFSGPVWLPCIFVGEYEEEGRKKFSVLAYPKPMETKLHITMPIEEKEAFLAEFKALDSERQVIEGVVVFHSRG